MPRSTKVVRTRVVPGALTPEQRRALVMQPFPVVRVLVEAKKTHGGCLIPDPLEDLFPYDDCADRVRRSPHRVPRYATTE